MEKRNKAIAIAAPYFKGESKIDKLYITSDNQVFTVSHMADGHAQRLKNKDIEIVTKSESVNINNIEVVTVPEVADRPLLAPVVDEIISAQKVPTADASGIDPETGAVASTYVEPLVDVKNADEVIPAETTGTDTDSVVIPTDNTDTTVDAKDTDVVIPADAKDADVVIPAEAKPEPVKPAAKPKAKAKAKK